MGEACSVHGGRRQIVTGFWCGNVKERDRLEDLRRLKSNIKIYSNPVITTSVYTTPRL